MRKAIAIIYLGFLMLMIIMAWISEFLFPVVIDDSYKKEKTRGEIIVT